MRILIVHNRYLQTGGEDVVATSEAALLMSAGHEVVLLARGTEEFLAWSATQKLLAVGSFGSRGLGVSELRLAIEDFKPDIVHFHNIYPMFGSGAIEEAARLGCATVRTLHNYRLTCIAGTHYRSGEVCERCDSGRRYPGVVLGCYRRSRLQSAAMAAACRREWRMITQRGLPHVLVCLSEFAKRRLVAAGMPEDRIVVKPNSVDAGNPTPWHERSGACFVGRLSPEKGVLELVKSWPAEGPLLTVAGDGPLREEIERVGETKASVSYIGAVDRSVARGLMRSSRVLVVPSLCYEGLPMTALEALSEATPVLGFSFGWFTEFLDCVGAPCVLHGDFHAFVRAAVHVAGRSEESWKASSDKALSLYRQRLSHERNLACLVDVYQQAIGMAGSAG